jgi:hypothetical protein
MYSSLPESRADSSHLQPPTHKHRFPPRESRQESRWHVYYRNTTLRLRDTKVKTDADWCENRLTSPISTREQLNQSIVHFPY